MTSAWPETYTKTLITLGKAMYDLTLHMLYTRRLTACAIFNGCLCNGLVIFVPGTPAFEMDGSGEHL